MLPSAVQGSYPSHLEPVSRADASPGAAGQGDPCQRLLPQGRPPLRTHILSLSCAPCPAGGSRPEHGPQAALDAVTGGLPEFSGKSLLAQTQFLSFSQPLPDSALLGACVSGPSLERSPCGRRGGLGREHWVCSRWGPGRGAGALALAPCCRVNSGKSFALWSLSFLRRELGTNTRFLA